MKKNTAESTIIKDGFVDYYYCYKLSTNNEYLKAYRRLLQDKCSIVLFETSKEGQILHRTKEEFDEYLESETKKLANKISKNINNSLKDLSLDTEIAVTVNSNPLRDIYSTDLEDIIGSTTNNDIIKFSVPFNLTEFINDSIMLTKEFIRLNNVHFNKNLKFYNHNLILQPLKILVNDVEHFINIRANIYGTGNVIIHYTIPINNVEFSNLYRTNNNLSYDTSLPSYIKDNNKIYDYSGNVKLEEAIKLYNEYIINVLGVKVSEDTFFTNYTLIDYTNIPNEFENASPELKRDLYWLSNYPYGYLNEQEKNKYNDFIKDRYSISLYASLFTSSNSRTIIAYNSKKTNIEFFDKRNEITRYRYNDGFIYLATVIEMLMIKRTYYSEIASLKISNKTTLRQLTSNYKQLIDIKNEFFRLTFGGYGSIRSLLDYLENNLIDYLPQGKIENMINNYKELISINESEAGEKRNYILSLLAVLFPILFGLNAIELLTTSLDTYLNLKFKTYSINLISESSLYAVEIWLTVIIISILLIYKHYLLYIFFELFNRLKYIIIKIKSYILISYYNISYWTKKKFKKIKKD